MTTSETPAPVDRNSQGIQEIDEWVSGYVKRHPAAAISTVVILNLIDMWNEFLYAVVLITADDKRTLPLGIMKFLGDYQTDYALLATGLMISVIPVIMLYAFFSERVVRGMTAGAVK